MTCGSCDQPLVAESQFCSHCGAPAVPTQGSGPSTQVSARGTQVVLEGKWALERKIGEGGMGAVFLARDLQLDRKVAIKLLHLAYAGDPELVARFEREARVTAGLEHPNIVPVFAVGRHEDRPFMVMKALEGRALSVRLREQPVLPPEEAMGLLRQLAAGLDFIHERGFVHRDVKAGNIFVGPTGLATLLDFGILRSRTPEAITRTGVVMGTPQYMSPEQALGLREIDHRSDLYALAVVLFECVAGRLPFDGDNDLNIIQQQAHSEPPDLAELAPWVPAEVGEVLRRGLAKRPEARFGSALELYSALEDAYLDSGVELFPPPPVRGSGERPALRASGSFPIPLTRRAEEPSTPAPPPPAPRRAWLLGGAAALGTAVVAAVVLGILPPRLAGPSPTPGEPDPVEAPSKLALADPEPPEPGTADPEPGEPLEPPPGALPDPAHAEGGQGLLLTPPGGLDGGVDLTLDDLPLPGSVEALALAGLAEVTEPALVEEAEAPQEAAEAPRPLQEPAPVRRPAPRRVERGPGKVNVITMHKGEPYWASLLVNGERKGTTPALLELPPGRHRIRVERTGFKPVERQIRVASGRSAVMRIDLVP